MHDASHHRLSKSKWINESIGEAFFAWPLGFTMHSYRRMHLEHHRHVSTDRDRDWVADIKRQEYQLPKSRREIFLTIIKYLSGIMAVKEIFEARAYFQNSPKRTNRIRYSTYALLLGASLYFSFWKLILLYWAVPICTSFMLFIYIRAVAEQHSLENEDALTITRSTVPNFLEAFLFCPWNVHYHLEHHLYPSVPFYHLPKLHKALLKNPLFAARAHVTYGIFSGLYREVRGREKIRRAA